MRRGPLVVVVLFSMCAGLAVLAWVLRIPPGPRSVVLITIDTLRDDRVGPRGAGAALLPSLTPALDALAARGTRFDQAWTVAPLTVPSHATILSGRLPAQHGLRTNRPRYRLAGAADRPWATLAEAMKEAGCGTAAFTSASVLRADQTGLDAGFDVYDEVPAAPRGSLVESERRGEETVTRALEWVRSRVAGGPVFLWVHLFDPHGPYDAPVPYGAGASHLADAQGYDGEVAYTDHQVGRLLDGLAAAGLGGAVVAVVADHGESLGEHGEATHGFLLHEATLHVPLILADGVRGVAAGARRSEPASTRDLAPTLLALAGAPIPNGMSQRTLLDRPPPGTAPAPTPVYAETLYGYDGFRWAQTFALRIGSWKLVDAGSETFETDLATDPRETVAGRPYVGPPPVSPSTGAPLSLSDGLDALRAAAAGPDAGGAPASPIAGGGYFGGGSAAALLPANENRRLPSPYARIGDLTILDTGKTFLQAGAADLALAQFDEVVKRDPANPEAQNWRGRALQKLKRPLEAAHAFRASFGLGWTDPACIEKGLQAYLQEIRAAELRENGRGATDAASEAIAFLESARGRGVPDSCMTAVFEVPIRLHRGEAAKARDAHARSRRFAPTPETDRFIQQNDELLGSPEAPPK
ncbi:MAG: sulfatase-like hydrolase/transferase [Planctomycetes bacterium]|nr:sulfatase-like hydrolase/transferase [Planctomycetota bacterium]